MAHAWCRKKRTAQSNLAPRSDSWSLVQVYQDESLRPVCVATASDDVWHGIVVAYYGSHKKAQSHPKGSGERYICWEFLCVVASEMRLSAADPRFPTDIARKNKWVALIRKSRKEPQWQPNKSSVVCSKHFHKYDLYMTERGLRRVKKSGYPKKNLPELDDQDIVDTISPITSAPPALNLPEFNPVIVVKKEEEEKIHSFTTDTTLPCSSAALALDSPDLLNPTVDDTILPCSSAAPTLVSPKWINPVVNDTILPCSSAASTFNLPELPDPLAVDTVLPSAPAESTPVPRTLPKMTDKLASIYETPREYKLRLKIERQKNIIQKKTKQIKILQQRVRRLQKKNKSLKDLLSALDTEPMQHSSALVQNNEDIIDKKIIES